MATIVRPNFRGEGETIFQSKGPLKLDRIPDGSRRSAEISNHVLRCKTSTGFSLLEVLLALGLTVVVFTAIAMATQTYLVALTKQQKTIERKQIARSVLSMVSNDLRAGIQYKATDYSGLENLIQTQQLMTNMVPAESEETEAGAETTDPAEEETDPIIVEEEVSFRPSLLGSESVLMIDISRLPRIDQYNPLVATASTLSSSPSDVKSIAYFVSSENVEATDGVEFEEESAPGGLYRREVDRAVAAYESDFSLITDPDQQTQLIAPEVAQLSFRYFDGSDWVSEWDSAENGGFPPAIEIRIVIDTARISSDNMTYSTDSFDPDTTQEYRSVVHLPVAEVVEEEE